MSVVIKCLPPFRILYQLPPDTNLVICIGGRGGAKTRNVSQFIAYAATVKKKRTVILRDEKETIKESILNEVLMRYDAADAGGRLSQQFQKLDTGIKEIETNKMMIFTKGFRASSNDKKAGLKSISDIDIAAIEELEDIRDEEKFNSFVDGIRNEGSLIILILNTPDLGHWVIKRYFTLETVDVKKVLPASNLDGYFDVIPKQIPGVVVIKTCWEDNPHLTKVIQERYRNYGNPDSHLYNPHYFLTAIKGYASSGLKGQIFSGWKKCTNDEFNEVDARSIFGQDFGNPSPAPLVEGKMVGNRIYLRSHNYGPMTDRQLAEMYCRLGLKNEIIIADNAEPGSIRRLRAGWQLSEFSPEEQEEASMARRTEDPPWKWAQMMKGWNIFATVKFPGSVKSGIKKVQDMEVYVTEGSEAIWFEYARYVWATDKNGNPTDEPVDEHNHCMDDIRYIVTGKGRYY